MYSFISRTVRGLARHNIQEAASFSATSISSAAAEAKTPSTSSASTFKVKRIRRYVDTKHESFECLENSNYINFTLSEFASMWIEWEYYNFKGKK